MTPAGHGRVLVTGASGFIGSALVRRCLAEGVPCAAFSRRPALAVDEGVAVHTGDATDAASVRRAMRGAALVVHAAGLAHQRGRVAPGTYDRVNADGTRSVAEAALAEGVRHLVIISSVAIYGRRHAAPGEDVAPQPETPYGASKLAAERAAAVVCARGQLPLTILRPATVVGRGDPGSVASLARLLLRRRFFWVGTGSHMKTLIDVDDLAAACLRVLHDHAGAGGIYNVGGWRVSLRDIVSALSDALGVGAGRVRVPAGVARVAAAAAAPLDAVPAIGSARARLAAWLSDDVYDASRFESRFGLAARTPWRDSLRREADWIQQRAPVR